MKNNRKKSNYFSAHPKKTLFFILGIFFILLLMGVEKFFGYTAKNKVSYPVTEQFIRFKHPPLLADLLCKSPHHGKDSPASFYRLRTDKDGFIIPSFLHENPDVTIFFLGGSTTQCTDMAEEERFPYLTGRLLEKDLNVKINSINSGASGSHSFHSINRLLNVILPFKPDIVIMMHNWNDLATLIIERSYWNSNPYRSTIVIKRRTIQGHFVQFIASLSDKFFPNLSTRLKYVYYKLKPSKTDEFATRRGKKVRFAKKQLDKEFAMNMQTFIDICRTRGVTPVLMTQASRLSYNDPEIRHWWSVKERTFKNSITFEQFQEMHEAFNDIILEKAEKNNVMAIDLAKEVPMEKEFFRDAVHLTGIGSTFVSGVISKYLKKIVHMRAVRGHDLHEQT
ncbi:MAG: SGNH/GDSL hydrolase family protein [Deltaproteobacteria bacterium]|nr:SGNH/GDSL hydrolase family protein [Deltaproteobacteria bacterium]